MPDGCAQLVITSPPYNLAKAYERRRLDLDEYVRGQEEVIAEYTGNPRGKNPGDVWIFPNVKANHVEKTIHPCQFPVELVERFILTVTQPGDLVVDPYIGVGTTACAAVIHGRRAAGAESLPAYV